MTALNDIELNVTGGWQPDIPATSHTLYYLTDEQIAELLKMGWQPGDQVYVRVIRISDGQCGAWMKLEDVDLTQYPAAVYRVQFVIFPA